MDTENRTHNISVKAFQRPRILNQFHRTPNTNPLDQNSKFLRNFYKNFEPMKHCRIVYVSVYYTVDTFETFLTPLFFVSSTFSTFMTLLRIGVKIIFLCVKILFPCLND